MIMASGSKRSWKLQEFIAHNANVNCLALGHKSGRVMVTGGDDKKVNLWAIGKQSCFMSLSGHTTPIECVQFNRVEELVCAGSRAGALKVWDLEAAKLVRTLTGHRDAINCVDFHPYGELLTSGSTDTAIKVWDSRKKGCICTFPSHTATVNSVKFSPDGQWIASGGDDSIVKIFDLRIGRVLKEFKDHIKPVTCVEFHPHEFLLATGAADKSVHFFDLENFNLVSTESDLGSIRCLWFNPDGECLFAGVKDYLKVIGWEPNRLYDSVPINWGRIHDISTAQCQLVGASFYLTNVTVYVADLKKVNLKEGGTFDSSCESSFSHTHSFRKSFSKAERPSSLRSKSSIDVKTIEESTSGTDPEEESSAADITNVKDYNDIFKARQSLTRTPPLEPEPFAQPESYFDPTEPQILAEVPHESFEALSLDNNINYSPSTPPETQLSAYSRSKSNLDQIYSGRLSKQDRENVLPEGKRKTLAPKFALQRQSSCKDVPDKLPKNNIKHSVSDASLSRNSTNNASRNPSRKNSFSRPNRNSSVPNVSRIPSTLKLVEKSTKLSNLSSPPVDIYVSPVSAKSSPVEDPDEFVPTNVGRPVGLDLDDFLPKHNQVSRFDKQFPDMSEAEVLGVLMRGHEPMMTMLVARQRNIKIVIAQYKTKDIKAAIETAIALGDLAIIVDLLGILNSKSSLWNLDLCVLLLPKIQDLLQSKFETYMSAACNSLKLMLRHFGSVIKTNIQSPVGSFGVDITREERYNKSLKCYDMLGSIRSVMLKKQTLPGAVGGSFREVYSIIQNTFD